MEDFNEENKNNKKESLEYLLLKSSRDILSHLQFSDSSCEENYRALYHVIEALKWINKRDKNKRQY